MIKLLQIHWGFALGGVAKYALLLQECARYGPVKTHSICILGKNWQSDDSKLDLLDHSKIMIRSRLDPSWVKPLVEKIRRREPDLVMTHGHNAHFVMLHSQRKLKTRVPWICSYHGDYHPISRSRVLVAPLFNRLTEHVISRKAQAVVAVADFCGRRLIEKGVPPERITVIHNGLPLLDGAPTDSGILRRTFGYDEGDIVLGVALRLNPVKGIRYLLTALQPLAGRRRNIKLAVFGDGTERAALQELSGKLGLDDIVRFHGYHPRVEEVLPLFDIFVLPSLAEYHSIALLEAMREGLPIVATDVGGNPESITHEVEGLLVPPADPAGLGEAINRLVDDSALRQRLGKAARDRFLRDFTEDVMLRKTTGWIMSCAESAQKKGAGN